MRLGPQKCDLHGHKFMAGSNREEAREHHWEVPKLKYDLWSKAMKRFCLIASVIAAICIQSSSAVRAQGGAKQGPEITRDPILEKDSLHNLEVARQYFKLRKAYVAALERCEEVLAANPEFSKIDEVLFIAGQSSANLAGEIVYKKKTEYDIHEGEKKVMLTSEEFREKARGYFSQILTEHPQSSFRGQADAALKELGEPKAKTVSSKQ